MNLFEIALPLALLALAFLLKLFIDRASTAPVFVSALLELPVDIHFLAMSFVVAFTITKAENANEGLLYFIAFLIAAILLIVFWRRSHNDFESSNFVRCGLLAILNYLLSCTGLYMTIGLVTGGNA